MTRKTIQRCTPIPRTRLIPEAAPARGSVVPRRFSRRRRYQRLPASLAPLPAARQAAASHAEDERPSPTHSSRISRENFVVRSISAWPIVATSPTLCRCPRPRWKPGTKTEGEFRLAINRWDFELSEGLKLSMNREWIDQFDRLIRLLRIFNISLNQGPKRMAYRQILLPRIRKIKYRY